MQELHRGMLGSNATADLYYVTPLAIINNTVGANNNFKKMDRDYMYNVVHMEKRLTFSPSLKQKALF